MELMKNGLNKPAIDRIAKAFSLVLTNFPEEDFKNKCLEDLEQLELKERIHHIIQILHQFLPHDFSKAAPLLIALKKHWDYGEEDDPLSSFAAWPVTDYVSTYGLDYPVESLNTLKELTELFSGEFAIRPFIVKYPDYCHEQFQLWIHHPNEHVRRLVSEGTRPRLPWGMQLKTFMQNPQPNIPLLSHLKDDKSLYVRRSVANHLNDIAKDNPNVVINVCEDWLINDRKNPDLNWVIKHATRSLVKSGEPEVFGLLGYTKSPSIKLSPIQLSSNNISMGETLNFDFQITSTDTKTQKLVADYVMYFVKANGKQNKKVFKLKNIELAGGECIHINKPHAFKEITTRKYYEGLHTIEIQINGLGKEKADFNLNI